MPARTLPDLRSLIAPYTEWAGHKFHSRFPAVQADHLSFLGASLVATGSFLAAHSSERAPALPLSLNLFGAATDAFNGVLARICYGDQPARLVRGNQVDSLSDFCKDISMGMSKIVVARRRGDRSSQALAVAATLTTPLASLSRSYKEKHGYKIPEYGNGYLEFSGTRAARTAFHAVAASNPSFRGNRLQPPLDALIVTGNLTRIAKNLSAMERQEQPIAALQKASFRTKFHAASAALTTVGVISLYSRAE